MDESIKQKMNRLNNIIIVMCLIALLGIVFFKKPAECDCFKIGFYKPVPVANI